MSYFSLHLQHYKTQWFISIIGIVNSLFRILVGLIADAPWADVVHITTVTMAVGKDATGKPRSGLTCSALRLSSTNPQQKWVLESNKVQVRLSKSTKKILRKYTYFCFYREPVVNFQWNELSLWRTLIHSFIKWKDGIWWFGFHAICPCSSAFPAVWAFPDGLLGIQLTKSRRSIL